MDKPLNKSNESSISTTGTTGSPPFSDTMENNVKYMNLNFIDNSESSSQAKEAGLEFQKIHTQAFDNAPKANKPPPSKILPTSIPLPGKYETLKPKSEASLKEKSLVDMGFKTNEIQGWEDIVQPPKENLYKLLKNMIDNHIKPNVQIRIGGVTFNCHMMVLQCYSDFFMECNNEVLIQLPEEKITPGAFMMVYDWMLAEEPLVQREGILELFNAANFLRIKNLVNQCWLCLDDDVRFREDTAFLLYLEARNYGLESLEQLMLTRICKFFLTLVASREFLELNTKEICTLLSSNTIGVNSEIEIFMSVVRWLNHNWEEREPDMLDVIKCVRFSLMPPWFLVTLNKNIDCVEIDRIASHPEVKRMINDGISYTTTQLYYGDNREEFLHFLERYQLVAPVQRQWVFDKECTYHHRLECPNMQYVTYKSFLEYLEMIQSIGKDYWRTLEMAKGVEKSMQCCVRSDCRKLNEQNLASVLTLKCRDQGVQVEASVKQRRTGGKVHGNHEHRAGGAGKITHSQKYAASTASSWRQQQDVHCCQYQHMVHANNNSIQHHCSNKLEFSETTAQHDAHYAAQRQPHQCHQDDCDLAADYVEHLSDSLRCPGGDCMGASNTVLRMAPSHMRASQTQTDFGKEQSKCADEAERAEQLDEMRVEQLPMHTITAIEEMEFKAVKRRKILIFGGIDPYCSHCLHEKLSFSMLKQQQQHKQHQQQQQIRQRGIHIGGSDADTMPPIASCYDNVSAGDKELDNYGDRVLYYDEAMRQWKHLCYIPFGSRHHHATVVCNGLIYIIGGTKTALGCTKKSIFEKSVWSFDPHTLKWTFECNLPELRRDFAAIACDEMVGCEHIYGKKGHNKRESVSGFYVIGGEGVNGMPLDTVYYYNIARKTWKKKASLNVGRYGLAAAMVNNEIWIAGGIIASKTRTSDGDDAAVAADGTGVDAVGHGGNSGSGGGGGGDAGGGGDGDGDGCVEGTKSATLDVISDSMEYYSLKCAHCDVCDGVKGHGDAAPECSSNGQWIKSKLHLRLPRLFGKFCKPSSNELYLIGGIGFNADNFLTSLCSVDHFNFDEGKWHHYGDLKCARHGHDIATLNDRIIIIGGVSTIKKCTLTTVESFCTKTRKSFKDIPALPWPLSGSSVVTLE